MLPFAIYLSCLAITATGTCAMSARALRMETPARADGVILRQIPECRSQCATVADWYENCLRSDDNDSCTCSDDLMTGFQSCDACLEPLAAVNRTGVTNAQARDDLRTLSNLLGVCNRQRGTNSGAAGASGTSKATTTTAKTTGKNTGAGTRMSVSYLGCLVGLVAVTTLL